MQTPAWLKEAVFYQIMPDRFRRGSPSGNDPAGPAEPRHPGAAGPLPASCGSGPAEPRHPGAAGPLPASCGSGPAEPRHPGAAGPLPASCGSNLMEWDAVPGSSRNGSREYFGGNLRGITERLDHIRDLGANAILLTPINAAPSYHRYDTTDHRQLDPLLGTWDDLAELIAAVHARGMRIVFDTALNHVSQHHPWFERARRDPSAPERSWFTFHEDGSYRCWWGHAGLPELRLDDPRLVEELITGEDSVLAFWLKKGFDGVRLDCANDLSLQTCALISYTIKSRFPDAAVIGEVANYAVPWLKGLDAAQSYFFTTSLKALQHGGITSGQFQENLRLAYGGGAFRQFQMLSSHDIPRAHTEFAADEAFHLAARRLQFTLPGIPMLYYGEEFGLEGGRDPKNRATVPWESSASRLKAPMSQEIRRLAALRTTSPELRHGLWEPLCVDGRDGLIAFFRALPEAPERLTVVIWNLLDEARTVTLTIPWGWLFSELVLEEVTTRKRGISNGGLVPFALEARECSIWQLRADHKRNYSFFKDWRRPVRE